ncbi:hypothetical protein JTE90_019484 [Oedothorax gibbosus]|uniref:Uncharacterized protein n=1 Tax=Oedothorax gibbosus TaxID=931172 RepID=A0AAV6UIK3_9ARAC|nr:hypothetical protein JTE90_019484 [Oedothorax gibbosus]
MIDEESYSALYLYNALIEYIYFLIILIQDGGPNHLDNVSKHVRFFKRDVYSFIQTFNGEDFDEKVGQMLCSATSAFEVRDNVVHLTKNCSPFKQVIYEDFLVSKVVDLVLRGICTVQDICQNLNFNSLIFIREKDLIEMIEYCPYFHFNSNRSVVLFQCHGLIGFERHIYDTTVNYFQSYFQNVSKLTYSDIKLHSSCIPCCAIRNSLIVFCLLQVSPYFKCKGGKISFRSRLKRKRNVEQVIDIEKLQSKGFLSIGVLVHEAFGPVISCWKGEISRLFNCAGLIQSVVSFRNGQHGLFFVYFQKTALKHCCEIGDLKQFLSARDVVEFDAEFCGKIMRGQVFWEATRLKVVNCAVKQSKYENSVDIEEYMTNIYANNFKMTPVLKACTVTNCGVEYSTFEKITANNNKQLSCLEIQNTKEKVSEEFLTLVSESDNNNSHVKITTEVKLDSISLTSNCDVNANLSETKSSDCQNVLLYNTDALLKIDIQNMPKKRIEENTLHNVVDVRGEITNSRKSSNKNTRPVLRAKVPSEISDQNKNLDTLYENEESKCPVQEPKKTKTCFEERNSSTHCNKVSTLHETKNKSFNSVLCTNSPKKNSNKNLKIVEEKDLPTHLNEALNPHEAKNKSSRSVLCSNFPKEISNKNLNAVEESQYKCTIQVPKTTDECFEEKNFLTHSNEASSSHETKNNSFKLVLSSNLPKEISNSSKNLNAVEENKCTIQVPKTTDKCLEEKNLPTHLNEASNPHETKNQSSRSVLCSNLPKKNSDSVKNLNTVKEKDFPSHPNVALNTHETNNKDFSSIHRSNLPKEILNSNKNLNSVSTEEENKCLVQVPKTTGKCLEEKDLPTHLNKTSSPHETISSYINLAPNGSNNLTFLFGVVTSESTNDGMADSCFENVPCEVFFKKNDICFQNGAGNVIGKGKTVLLFVPYVDIEDRVLIATFVYPLTPAETIKAENNGFRAQDFIVNHFSSLLKRSLSDTYTCDCDISKSLLMRTQLRPNFNDDKKTSANDAIKRLSEVCKMSAKTYEHLCSIANQFCVQNMDEAFKKLLSILRVSTAKRTPSKCSSAYKLRNNSTNISFKVDAKKATLDDYVYSGDSWDNTQSIAFEENAAVLDDNSGDSCDSAQSIAFEENAAVLDDNSGDSCDNAQSIAFEENAAVLDDNSGESYDNRNIVNLKTTANDHSIDHVTLKKDYLKVNCDSCSSVSSFLSCLGDLTDDEVLFSCESDLEYNSDPCKESPEKNKPLCGNKLSVNSSSLSCFDDLPDDVFYSCESDFDSNPSLCKESPEKSEPLRGNTLSAASVNGINFKSWRPISPNKSFEVKPKQKVEKKFRRAEDKNSYLKLRHFSLFKHKKRKRNVILPMTNNYCKSCHKPSLTALAEIIMIKKSCIYFELISEEDNAIFAFPKSLIPVEMHKRIRLSKTITVILDPHPLLSLSQVMQLVF